LADSKVECLVDLKVAQRAEKKFVSIAVERAAMIAYQMVAQRAAK
jgi:hypothetical protein